MVFENFSLKNFNTFGLDYKADRLLILNTEAEAASVLRTKELIENPLFIIGGGSNLLLTGDFKGTMLHPAFSEINIEESHGDHVIVSADGGLIWDKLVEWSVNEGLGGLENLSLIPGTVGATPVQNIGAYGIEIKDTIEKVRAISVTSGSIVEFTRDDCKFGYRTSIFKNIEKGNYLITRVYYKLSLVTSLNLSYGALKAEVSKLGSETLKNVRQAVINIRQSKLPDPREYGNAGSFFKNPVVLKTLAEDLRKEYPELPCFEDKPGKVKLAAGWLIEQCGWKGKRIGDAGVHDRQALVIVNYGNATGKDIFNLSEEIKRSVYDRFGIGLEREVEVVGTI
jgi:UDP-N-acetylmuramate dehydrogenase